MLGHEFRRKRELARGLARRGVRDQDVDGGRDFDGESRRKRGDKGE